MAAACAGRSEGERAEIERRRLVLAIESSCDETAVAIIDADGNMLANQVSTQIDFHARFGGVVPEIASRKHVEVIVSVVDAALEDAAASLGLEGGAIAPSELAAVGVTQGPGLVGASWWALPLPKALPTLPASRSYASTIWRGTCLPTCWRSPTSSRRSSSRLSRAGTPCSCT